jgi:hypothetical protein
VPSWDEFAFFTLTTSVRWVYGTWWIMNFINNIGESARARDNYNKGSTDIEIMFNFSNFFMNIAQIWACDARVGIKINLLKFKIIFQVQKKIDQKI